MILMENSEAGSEMSARPRVEKYKRKNLKEHIDLS